MPIAHCVLAPQVIQNNNESIDLIEKWGEYSGIDTSEMTVTIVRAEQQMGKDYSAICTLYLPSLWSSTSVNLLQVGLVKALSEYYDLKSNDVIVMTSIIESGCVVEGGVVLNW